MSRSSFEGFPQPKKDSGGTKTGDATAGPADILTPKTAYGPSGKIIGTMPNRGGVNSNATGVDGYTTPQVLGLRPLNGYWDGTYWTLVTDTNWIAANFRADKTIFGLAGTMPVNVGDKIVTGSGGAGQILAIPPNALWNGGDRVVLQDGNFIAANLPNGLSMFGLAGNGGNVKKYAKGRLATNVSGQLIVTGLAFTPAEIMFYMPSDLGNQGSYSQISVIAVKNTPFVNLAGGTQAFTGSYTTTATTSAGVASMTWGASNFQVNSLSASTTFDYWAFD